MKSRSRSPLTLARLHGFARAMRAEPTQSERLLWAELSARKLGVAFRRQAVVQGYIMDFLAPARKLIVERVARRHRPAEVDEREIHAPTCATDSSCKLGSVYGSFQWRTRSGLGA